jgi:hypothetical protein
LMYLTAISCRDISACTLFGKSAVSVPDWRPFCFLKSIYLLKEYKYHA